MRITNLIMQGLIAGAILFIPAEVFAEKENAEKRNSTAQQNSQSALKQGNETHQIPEHAGREEHKSISSVSEDKRQNKMEKTPVSKGSGKSAEVKQTKPGVKKAKSTQKANKSNGIEKSVHQGQIKKNLQRIQSDLKKAETSKLIHTETPINEMELPKNRVEDEHKEKLDSPKRKGVNQQKKADSNPSRELPSEEVPKPPVSKAVPVNAGQGSSHSSASKEGGNGTAALAGFKASLVLPLIFADSEKVSVYFSRMDLLRSQWVNAPPSMPPKTAL